MLSLRDLETYLETHVIVDSDSRQWRLTIDPHAKASPPAAKNEYELLKKKIEKGGQRDPIIIVDSTQAADGSYTGVLLDGITRLKCCVELSLAPKVEIKQIEDRQEYVHDLNVARRHLTSGQKAAYAVWLITSELLNSVGKNYTVEDAAKEVKLGHEIVERAKRLQTQAPDLFEQVREGLTTVNAAYDAYQIRREKAYQVYEPSVFDSIDPGWRERLDIKPPVPIGSPAEPKFVADLKAAATVLKDARRRVALIGEYLRLRVDWEERLKFANGFSCSSLIDLESAISCFGNVIEELEVRKFIPSNNPHAASRFGP